MAWGQHSQCSIGMLWTANPSLYHMKQCREMFGLALETSWLLGMNHDWARYAKLACNYLGKAEWYVEYGSMDIFIIFPIMFFSHRCSAQPKDTY